jgi:hypothetical protein
MRHPPGHFAPLPMPPGGGVPCPHAAPARPATAPRYAPRRPAPCTRASIAAAMLPATP